MHLNFPVEVWCVIIWLSPNLSDWAKATPSEDSHLRVKILSWLLQFVNQNALLISVEHKSDRYVFTDA